VGTVLIGTVLMGDVVAKRDRWLLASLLALTLAGCASRTTPSGSGSGNTPAGAAAAKPVVHYSVPNQKVFAPYDQSGKLAARVTGSEHGTCWTSSISIPVSGVYRCLAHNQILDPCFAPAVETTPLTVSCFADPWSPGTRVTLGAALPKDEPVLKDGSPWALELGNGAHCVVVTGAVPVLDGFALQYRCDAGAVASLQTAGDGSVGVLYGPAGGPLGPAAVLAVWRGHSYRFASTA
jgi:hypothetical protein